MVPEYAAARGTAQSFFKANDALEAGELFVTSKYGLDEAKAAIAGMTQQERDLFAEGFASRFIQKVQRLSEKRDILNAINNSPEAKQKLIIALGANRARSIESFLRVEETMDLARKALGNSTTARQLVELGATYGAGAYGALGAYNEDPGALMVAALVIGGKAYNSHITRRVAEEVVKKLLSTDTSAFIKGVKQIAASPMLDALRAFDNIVAKSGIGRSAASQEGSKALSAPEPMVPKTQSPAAPSSLPGAAPSGPPVAPPTAAPGGPPASPPTQSTVVKPQAAIDPAEAYELASEAIAAGAPIEAVKQRLAEFGVDPAGLA